MSKSTWALFVLLAVLSVGAIAIATQFRTKLISPAGQRLAAENRLRVVITGVIAYRNEQGAWPEQLAQVIRSGRLQLNQCTGVQYRRPALDAAPDRVVVWRETVLPAVPKGQPWSGPEDLAPHDMPAVGMVATVDGQVRRLDPAAFAAATAPR